MELQTGEFPGWDRSPVAFIRTCVVSQFATIAITFHLKSRHIHFSSIAQFLYTESKFLDGSRCINFIHMSKYPTQSDIILKFSNSEIPYGLLTCLINSIAQINIKHRYNEHLPSHNRVIFFNGREERYALHV